MRKIKLISIVFIASAIYGCASAPQAIFITNTALPERHLKYIVDERPQDEVDSSDSNIFSSSSKIPLKLFSPNPLQLIDLKIEERFGNSAIEKPLHIQHFDILDVDKQSHGRAVASAFAGISYITAVLMEKEALQKQDYALCYVTGTVNGQPFKVKTTAVYRREAFKSAWGSKDFLDKLREVANNCIAQVLNRYTEFSELKPVSDDNRQ